MKTALRTWFGAGREAFAEIGGFLWIALLILPLFLAALLGFLLVSSALYLADWLFVTLPETIVAGWRALAAPRWATATHPRKWDFL